jgi:hypothetical protein
VNVASFEADASGVGGGELGYGGEEAARVEAADGSGPGDGGDGAGGLIEISALGNAVLRLDDMSLNVSGQGGDGSQGATGGAGGSGGDGFGGELRLVTRGGTIELDPGQALALSAIGRGGSGGLGGRGAESEGGFEGPGGNGGAGGSGIGGVIAFDIVGGAIGFGDAPPAAVRLDVSGLGGSGALGGQGTVTGTTGAGALGAGGSVEIGVADLVDEGGDLISAGRAELGATTLIARGTEGAGASTAGGRAGAITIRETSDAEGPSLIFDGLTVVADHGLPAFSFLGTLATGSDTASFNFVSELGGTIVAQSYGFSGGVNRAGEVIAAGGFDPILRLFNATNTRSVPTTIVGTGGQSSPAGDRCRNLQDPDRGIWG